MAVVFTTDHTMSPAQSLLPSSNAGMVTPTTPNNAPAELNLQQSETNGTWGNASVMSFHGAAPNDAFTIPISGPNSLQAPEFSATKAPASKSIYLDLGLNKVTSLVHTVSNAALGIIDVSPDRTIGSLNDLGATRATIVKVPNIVASAQAYIGSITVPEGEQADVVFPTGNKQSIHKIALVGPTLLSNVILGRLKQVMQVLDGCESKEVALSIPSQFHKKTEIGNLTLWHKAKFVDGLKADTVTINMADGTILNLKTLKSASEVTFDPKTGFSGDNLSYEIENVALDFSFIGESVRASLDYDQEFTERQATHLAGESAASDSSL